MDSSVSPEQNKHSYVVVLRGPSSALFSLEHPSLTVRQFPSAAGPVDVTFRTNYVDEGFSTPVPRGIWIDVRGEGGSLKQAQDAFPNAAYALLPLITLSANALVPEPDVELGYETTPGLTQRQFFQIFLPNDSGIPRHCRRVPVEETLHLIRAVASHPDSARLHRASAQYHQALCNWLPGQQTLALAHLWMGMEAITEAGLRQICQERGCDQPALAAAWGVPKGRKLRAEVRRRCLFQGDDDCYKKAKEASDSFEHGYSPLPRVHDLASAVRDPTALYLRSAIVDLVGLEEAARKVLLSPPYHRPLPSWPYTKILRGRLLDNTDQFASKDREHPRFAWNSSIDSLSRNESGEYSVSATESLKALLGDGISFQRESFQVWGPPPDDD